MNVASGAGALYHNTKGSYNAAQGANLLVANKLGNNNTADGFSALIAKTGGNGNTAAGAHALSKNTTGDGNISLGHQAGSNLTTGNNNIDIGAPGVANEANTIRSGIKGTQTAHSFEQDINRIDAGRGCLRTFIARSLFDFVPWRAATASGGDELQRCLTSNCCSVAGFGSR